MLLFLLLIGLFGLPGLLIVWLIYRLLKKKSGERKARKWRNSLLFVLGLGISSIMIFDFFSRRHWVTFKLNEKYELSILAIEIPSFLDAPTEFRLSFEEVESGETTDFKIFTGWGPQIKFLLSEDNENLLIIKGFDYNVASGSWVVDLENKTIHKGSEEGNFVESAWLGPDYRIKK